MQVLLYVIYEILWIYFYVLLIYIILTWTPIINTPFGRFMKRITDPFLSIFRGWLVIGMFDFTPLIGLLLYQFLLQLLSKYI